MDPLPSCMKCFTTHHILSHSWSGKADFKFELLKVENSWEEYRIKALFPTNNLLNYLKLWWISTMEFWLCWMQTDVSCAKVLQKEFYHLCCCHVSIKGKNKLKSFCDVAHTGYWESPESDIARWFTSIPCRWSGIMSPHKSHQKRTDSQYSYPISGSGKHSPFYN